MAIARRTGAVGTGWTEKFGTSATITINKPSNVVSGDLLLAVIHASLAYNVAAAPTMTTPASGWTLQASRVPLNGSGGSDGGQYDSAWVYTKVAGGSEPSTYSWVVSGAQNQGCGLIEVYTGVDTTTPMDVTPTTNGGNSSTATATGLTTVTDGAMAIAIPALEWGLASATFPPSGWTNGSVDATNLTIATVTKSMTTAGSTGSPTFTTAGASGWGTFMLALRPASSGTPATVDAPSTSVTLSGAVPVITAAATIFAVVATATLAAFAPAVSGGATVTAPAAQVTISGAAPAVSSAANVAIPNSSLTVAGVAPAITAGATIIAPAATLTIAAANPTITAGANVTAPAAGITLTAPTSVISSGATVTAPASNIIVAGNAPTVTGTAAGTVDAPAATISLTAYPPTVTAGSSVTVTVPVSSVTVAATAPTVTAGATVNAPAGTVTIQAIAPAVTGRGTDYKVTIRNLRVPGPTLEQRIPGPTVTDSAADPSVSMVLAAPSVSARIITPTGGFR